MAVPGCCRHWAMSSFWAVGPTGLSPTGLNTPSQKELNDVVSQMFGCVEKVGSHEAVVGGRVVLGVIVGKIGRPRPPVDEELSLASPVLDPIKAHVHGFGSFLLDGIVGKTFGGGVVDLHGGWRLWMAHFLQGTSLTSFLSGT